MSPSGSLATPLQVKVVLVVTPVLGDIEAAVSKTGSLLSTVTAADDVATADSESLMDAVQIMSSVGLELLPETVMLVPAPIVPPLASVQK